MNQAVVKTFNLKNCLKKENKKMDTNATNNYYIINNYFSTSSQTHLPITFPISVQIPMQAPIPAPVPVPAPVPAPADNLKFCNTCKQKKPFDK